MGFAKIFEQIHSSTIAELPVAIRYVWISLLTICDRHGIIDKTHESIARQINVDEPTVREAIEIFCGPDPMSRSPEEQGRRLAPLRDGGYGWRVVNFEKYRDMGRVEQRKDYLREKSREYMRRRRAEEKLASGENSAAARFPTDEQFETVWADYALKRGKDKARAAFKKSVKSPEDLERFRKALTNYKAELAVETWKKPMHGSRFFREWPEYVDRQPRATPQGAPHPSAPNLPGFTV